MSGRRSGDRGDGAGIGSSMSSTVDATTEITLGAVDGGGGSPTGSRTGAYRSLCVNRIEGRSHTWITRLGNFRVAVKSNNQTVGFAIEVA